MSRLPIVNGDDGAWGTVLNDYLAQSHNADGSIKRMDPLLGYKMPTFDGSVAPGAGTLTSQTVYGGATLIRAGEVVTNVITCIQIAGAGTAPTTIRLGIASVTGVMQAITANVNAVGNWNTVGAKAIPLTAPWTCPADGIYYLMIVENGAFATTPVQLVKGTANASFGVALAGFPPQYGSFGTAATDLPAVGASLTAWAQLASPIWMAWN